MSNTLALRTALAGIPYAGSAILEILNGLAQRRNQERLNSVFDQMTNRLNQLGEEKLDREYFRSEEFQSLLFLLLERIHTTHDSDKLRMFGNALANSSSLDFKADDKEQYIRVLRELSLSDLNILNDGRLRGWFPFAHAIEYAPGVMVSLSRLQGMGLVLEKLGEIETIMGWSQPPKKSFHISEFGAKFLDFVSGQANSDKS